MKERPLSGSLYKDVYVYVSYPYEINSLWSSWAK